MEQSGGAGWKTESSTRNVTPRTPLVQGQATGSDGNHSPSMRPPLNKTLSLRSDVGRHARIDSASSSSSRRQKTGSESGILATQRGYSPPTDDESTLSVMMWDENSSQTSRTSNAKSSFTDKKPVREALYMEEGFDDGKSTPITDAMIQAAAAASGTDVVKLTSISLQGQYISSSACLKSCPQLRTLDLSGNRLRIIEGTDSLPQLR
jgi:Leucine-rich repeat (LRR) protein